jgi:transglutaminase-like putative cysteine protease
VQTLRLTPVDAPGQRVLDWSVQTGAELWREIDPWGNVCHGHTVDRPGRVLVIRAGGALDSQGQAERVDHRGVGPELYRRPSQLAMADEAIVALAKAALPDAAARPGACLPAATELLALADHVRQAVTYRTGVTHAATTAAQALRAGAGVCQDHAHVFIAACRSLGWAARYVSGYFLSEFAGQVDGTAAADASARLPRAECSAVHSGAPPVPRVHASHAWAEVCVAPAERRWLAIDVTHACLTDERHVRLAQGPDYSACLPIRGVRVGGDGETLDVDIRISLI